MLGIGRKGKRNSDDEVMQHGRIVVDLGLGVRGFSLDSQITKEEMRDDTEGPRGEEPEKYLEDFIMLISSD